MQKAGTRQAVAFAPTADRIFSSWPIWCPTCRGLWAGSHDEPNCFKPQINLWTRSAPAWSRLDPDMERLDVAPNAEQFRALLDGGTQSLGPVHDAGALAPS